MTREFGEDGSFGGATFDYTFNTTTTTQSMPPSEEIRVNNVLQEHLQKYF